MKVRIAKLREDGLFLGLEEIDEKDLTEDHVHKAVADGTDLAPGKYRWEKGKNEFGGSFVPIDSVTKPITELRGNATGALYALVLALMEEKTLKQIPLPLAQWIAHYSRTVDAKGLKMGDKK